MKTHYTVLDISTDADVAEIRDAYRRLVQQNIDDKDAFDAIQTAYETLISSDTRATYDKSLNETSVDATLALDRTMILDGNDTNSQVKITCPIAGATTCPNIYGSSGASGGYCTECGVSITDAIGREFELIIPSGTVGHYEEETGRKHPLKAGDNTVGRDGSDVVLNDKTVSRSHATFHLSDGTSVTIEDLGSTNGTHVNGERLQSAATRQIVSGDTVRFGNIRGVFRIDHMSFTGLEVGREAVPIDRTQEIASHAIEDFQAAQYENSSASRIVLTRSNHPDIVLMPGLTTFGRRVDNTVVLPTDPYVSVHHAQISRMDDQCVLIDVGSTNGTLYNGTRIPPHEPVQLNDGDSFALGNETFTVSATRTETDADTLEDIQRTSASSEVSDLAT